MGPRARRGSACALLLRFGALCRAATRKHTAAAVAASVVDTAIALVAATAGQAP
jgi:hypothetical protein